MPNFEITAVGFNAADDATDDRVLWVSTPTRFHLDHVINGEPHIAVVPLPDELCTDPQDFDFVLPNDDRELRTKLREFAADLPTPAS